MTSSYLHQLALDICGDRDDTVTNGASRKGLRQKEHLLCALHLSLGSTKSVFRSIAVVWVGRVPAFVSPVSCQGVVRYLCIDSRCADDTMEWWASLILDLLLM